MRETPKDAAKRLFAPFLAKGYKPQALHAYRDTEGASIYFRVRAKHADGNKAIRPMHLNGNGYQLGEPKWEGPKPIYNLDRIAKAAPDAPIFIVEGEWAADHLTRLGILSTTSGGADSADRADWTPLKGHPCIIWRDLDEPGRMYEEEVTAKLRALECPVSHINVEALGLAPKGDAVDWLAANPNAAAADVLALPRVAGLQAAQADAPMLTPSPAAIAAPDTSCAAWPSPLPDEAFIGLAGDIVRALRPMTEADDAAILLQVLIAFGALCGRGRHVRIEGDCHYPQLFGLVVGDTSNARKGTSWGRVREVFSGIPGWPKVVDGLSSGEGLKFAVRDAVTKRGKNGADEVVDEGVADKRLLVVEAEFAQVLRQGARSGNTLSSTIRGAWDTGTLATLTKNDPVTATGAHISIVGHITSDELRAELTATDSANGFANRFLFMCAKRSKMLPRGGGAIPPGDLADIRRRLEQAAKRASLIDGMDRSPEAWDVWERAYPTLTTGHAGLLGAVTARAAAQCVRLALIYALLDEADEIDTRHILAALAVWERAEESARCIFGSALGDAIADEILRALRVDLAGLTRTKISQLFGRHATAERIGAALDLLTRRGLAKRFDGESTGGRPAEVWKLA